MQIGKKSRTALEAPLNSIFSSEANVRILRELLLAEAPLSKSAIASRSGVSLGGVVKALPRLFATGLVQPVGTGGRQQVAIRSEHPLSGTVGMLFRTEALQKQQLISELTHLLTTVGPPVRSAWLDEEGWTGPLVPLRLEVLAGSSDVSSLQDELRPRLAELSARFAVLLELSVRTAADLALLSSDQQERLKTITPVYGANPLLLSPDAGGSPSRRSAARTHADREAESLRRAMWIADLLDRDPTLPQRARRWVVHRLYTASERESADLGEWLAMLETAPIPTLQYVLLRVDERSDRLRQTNPFVMALTPDEKARMAKETAR